MNNNIIEKIKSDEFYSQLLENGYDYEYIQKAGFFEDTDYDINLENEIKTLCTPLDHIKDTNNSAIIISTGSFAPFHKGHYIQFLEAKVILKERGFKNIYGFIAPDSDKYVVDKKLKDSNFTIENRIDKIHKMTSKDISIKIDPWMSFYHKDINFTTYISRLKAYIKKYLNTDIPIYFLCGGDCSGFWRAFEFSGNCIIFNRKDSNFKEEQKLFKSKQTLENKNRILFVHNYDINISSTKIRNNEKPNFFDKKENILIRKSEFNNDNNDKYFLNSLEYNLKKYFKIVKSENVKDQKTFVSNLYNNDNIISLDSLIKLKYNIRVSRIYDSFGINKLYYNIDKDKSNEPDNHINTEYILFDDDIFTGGTIEYVRNYLLEKGYILKENPLSLNTSKDNFEICDSRDFLIGISNSGLYTLLPNGKHARIPYLYPFVFLPHRLSLSHKDSIRFSINILYRNKLYFGNKLIDKNSEQYEFWKLIGMENTPINEICDYWIDYLTKLL